MKPQVVRSRQMQKREIKDYIFGLEKQLNKDVKTCKLRTNFVQHRTEFGVADLVVVNYRPYTTDKNMFSAYVAMNKFLSDPQSALTNVLNQLNVYIKGALAKKAGEEKTE